MGLRWGATRAFMRSLWALAHEPEVTHFAIAFDTVIESFRNQLFDGYKTGAGIEPLLFAQFPLVEEAARAMGFVTWSMIDFEADDAIGTAAVKWADQVERVVICSPDKDFGQVVRGDHIVQLDRIRKVTYNEAGVIERLGVPPGSIPDLLALVGDPQDGIPGVPRWGAKSASTVLKRWLHVEAIPDDPAHWEVPVRGAASLAESLRGMRQEVALYKTLATLRYDVPLAEDFASLRRKGVDRPALAALCARLGDARFLARVDQTPL